MQKFLSFAAILFFGLIPASVCAQYSWFREFTGGDQTVAEKVSVAPNNTLSIITGFTNGLSIPGMVNYTGKGSAVIWFSPEGAVIRHVLIRYSSGDTWGLSKIATDAQGNTYITGMFPQTVTIAGVTLTGENSYNTLIAKFDSQGNLVWTKVIRVLQNIFDLKVNEAGEVLVYSYHWGTVTIDNVSTVINSNAFAFQLDTNGQLKWCKRLGDVNRFTTWPLSAGIDNAGNTYFYGIYNGTLTLDSKQITSTGGFYDYFVTRLAPGGTCDWITAVERKIPSEQEPTNPPNGIMVEAGALETDNLGNVYTGGAFVQGLKAGTLTASGAHTFLLKLNPEGIPQWIKTPTTGIPDFIVNSVGHIAIRNGKVHVSGNQSGSLYLASYGADGTVMLDTKLFPITVNSGSTGLAVDSQDSLYVCGTQPIMKGYFFKYREGAVPQPVLFPGNAGEITEPTVFCDDQNSVIIRTKPIEHASSFEWEIRHGNVLSVLTSEHPELPLVLSDYGITGEFEVRVVGVNSFGKGSYSNWHAISSLKRLAIPELSTTCITIQAESDDELLQLKWYREGEQLLQYTGNQSSIKPNQSGTYHITIANACGVVTSEPVVFDLITHDGVVMPNVITPDGDGKNDFFTVDHLLDDSELRIMNRWGEVVYETAHYQNEWGAKDLNAGIYYYMLSSQCLSTPYKGWIHVIK